MIWTLLAALSAAEPTLDAELLDLMLRVGSRWVLWLLLALSLLAIAVALERVLFYVLERRPANLQARLMAVLSGAGGAVEAVKMLQGVRSMEVAVARLALTHASQGPQSVEEHIAGAIERERLRYERMLAFLGTLGNNAPFIGLFGTVLGIIRAFHDLAANSAQGAQAVMAGIAEALVATAIGLLVALPAVAMYNLFARHVEATVAGATAIGHAILAFVKAVPSTTPAAVDPAAPVRTPEVN
ncbi:MAG: MotA/TolQ/ExbB proton channel family protein [Myxococcales bacterium]|nr:MotA/TolQ/ExbB proton channel family protein [Myxococcales bacterium]